MKFAGLIAWPCYDCTNRVENGVLCMRVAPMSDRFSQEHARKPYRCRICTETFAHVYDKDDAPEEPDTASANLRMLYVWPLCLGDDDGVLPVNTHRITVLLHAPPQTWGWGGARRHV